MAYRQDEMLARASDTRFFYRHSAVIGFGQPGGDHATEAHGRAACNHTEINPLRHTWPMAGEPVLERLSG